MYIGPLFWEALLPCFPGTPTPNWVPVIPVPEELWIISTRLFSHKTLSGALTLIYLGTLVITVALVAKSFGAYASRLFLPDRAVPIYSTALFCQRGYFAAGGIEYGGARAVGKSEVIMVAFKLLILTVLMLASFGSSVPVGADPIPVKGLDGLLGSVGLTFFAFAGYGMMANTAGNLKNPSRTLPRAIFMAIGLVLALYLILSYVVLSNVPATSLESHTETAVAQAAYPVLGMWGFMAVSVAALIATASAINATMFSMLDISRLWRATASWELFLNSLSGATERRVFSIFCWGFW